MDPVWKLSDVLLEEILMKQSLARIVAISILFCSTVASPNQQNKAEEIMKKVQETYSRCISYFDEGVVTVVFTGPDVYKKRTQIKPFTTSFMRPGQFRFEFKERRGEYEWNSYIVWRDGGEIKTWWSLKPVIRSWDTLNIALGGAAGVSSRSAVRVPGLLMPEMNITSDFRGFRQLSIAGEENLDGVKTFKISALFQNGRMETIWVDKERYLVLQTQEKQSISPDLDVESTTLYHPRLNDTIPANRFAMNFPAS